MKTQTPEPAGQHAESTFAQRIGQTRATTCARAMTPSMALVVALAAPLTTTPAAAQDRADIDRAQIIGNRELPKVLYIVPWKKPRPGELAGKPPGSVLDEALAPVDRDVFRRELSYDAQTRFATGTASTTAPVTASIAAPAATAASPLPR